ncbi:MAG: ComF family protein [Fimbriimonadaceae bacterium]
MARKSSLLEAIFPTRCGLCGLVGPSFVCEFCETEMLPSGKCLAQVDEMVSWYGAVYDYTGRAAQAVRRLKFNRVTSVAEWMSDQVAAKLTLENLKYDLAIPVPIHWSRRCLRGFNQSELLSTKIPRVSAGLLRFRRTKPQVGLSAEERLENLRGAFRANESLKGKSVLIVDDVITSGGTIIECARALKNAGAIEVNAIAFCGSSSYENDSVLPKS